MLRRPSALTGFWIVGVLSMGMLVALVSGVIVHKKIIAQFFTFRPRKRLQRSALDLHNLTGVLALPSGTPWLRSTHAVTAFDHGMALANRIHETGRAIARASSIEDAFAQLAGSTTHRANMLNRAYLLTGVGTARAKDGSVYAVQLFIRS